MTKEEADRAIEQLDGNEVQERKVSVQLARKPGATSAGPKKQAKPQQGPSEPREEGAAAASDDNGEQGKRGRGGIRGRGRGRVGRAKVWDCIPDTVVVGNVS